MKSPTSLPRPKNNDSQKRSWMLRRVHGESMYPALEDGQLVIIHRTQQYRRGEVVVFVHNNVEKVKRIDGVEGDFLYVIGDNPRFSSDSRNFGYINKQSVIGRVVWPKL